MTKGRRRLFVLALVGTSLLISPQTEAASQAQLQAYEKWNAKIDAVQSSAAKLIERTGKLDQLTRKVVDKSVGGVDARFRGSTIISDLRDRLKGIREDAKAVPPPPVLPDQAKNRADQTKRSGLDQLVNNAANVLETSIAIYQKAMDGEPGIEKQLYLKFSRQMIVLLEAENRTNRAAVASQPRNPLHPQYDLLSCVIENNEAMIAIWQAVIDVSRGQDAARIHDLMRQRILRADKRVKKLAREGGKQVKVYRKLFSEGMKSGRFPKSQVDLLNRMMDTYDPAYEVEKKIADALVAYAKLPNMAKQTDAHRRKAEQILGAIGPLAEERDRLQAKRTKMAKNL